jgi:hypothetical protein
MPLCAARRSGHRRSWRRCSRAPSRFIATIGADAARAATRDRIRPLASWKISSAFLATASPRSGVEIDIRPVTEPWDIGLDDRPAELSTRRYMVLREATADTEAGASPSSAARSRLSQLIAETTRTGLHLTTEAMAPSRKGRRYKNTSNGVTFFDGPMIETKELIGGYVIVSAESLEEACR